jgi:hypothetical protein
MQLQVSEKVLAMSPREREIWETYWYERLCQIAESGRLKRWRDRELAKLQLRDRLAVVNGGRSDD